MDLELKKELPNVSEAFLGGLRVLELRDWLMDYFGISLSEFTSKRIRYVEGVRLCRDLFVYYVHLFYGVSIRAIWLYYFPSYSSHTTIHKCFIRGKNIVECQ